MVYPPNSPALVDSGPKGGDHEVRANFPVDGSPGHGFHGLHGSELRHRGGTRPGDRQSDLLDSFGAVFVLIAVAFGPALTWLLVG
jgi:hypothetical protein